MKFRCKGTAAACTLAFSPRFSLKCTARERKSVSQAGMKKPLG
ncbi:hypothetical protein [Dysgonomonas sp. 37-18]|nr:hypothetical protein [Dysgonomonas sp. 37-18]